MKIGIDAVSVERLSTIKNLNLILSTKEQKLEIQSQAGAIAAKEALAKALGIMPPPWLEIEIMHTKNGAPYFRFSDKISKLVKSAELSITHESGMAIAVVLLKS